MEKDKIFPKRSVLRVCRRLFAAKYAPGRLEAALRRVFGETLLGESRIPLVVPAYNLGENDVYIFKTPHHERLRRDHKVPMWAVAMATSAAPTFFPAFRLPDDHARLVDGGVWANNPAMVGVTEAVSMFGQRPEEVRVLSLGTTSSTRCADHGPRPGWAGPMAPFAERHRCSPQRAECRRFQRGGNIWSAPRTHTASILPLPTSSRSSMPATREDLIAKASHHSRMFCPTFERVFGSHIPSPYVPLYGPNAEEVSLISPLTRPANSTICSVSSIADFDIPDDLYDRAVATLWGRRNLALRLLGRVADGRIVYPQGSFPPRHRRAADQRRATTTTSTSSAAATSPRTRRPRPP